MTTTQVVGQPPNNTGKFTAAGFPDDEIREIGDQIANLTLLQAKELLDYLDQVHGVKCSLSW